MQITFDEHSIIGEYIKSKAAQSGRTPDEVVKELTQDGFNAEVRALHERFLRGEFSQATMAKRLGIPRIDLIHLLEEMGLQVTNL